LTPSTEYVVEGMDLEEVVQTGLEWHLCTLLTLGVNRGDQLQLALTLRRVFDFLAAHALQFLLQFELEDFSRVCLFGNFLSFHDIFQNILEILSCILLLTRLKFRMILAYKLLENCWSHTLLVVFILILLLLCHLLSHNLLSEAFLGVFATGKSIPKLPDLALEAIRRELLAAEEMLLCTLNILLLEVRL
jgi:hypothetical protein